MGRTNPTFRDLLTALEGRWGDFRRVLRRRDQPRFDRLFEYARAHADAASYLNHEEPLFPALVGMLLEQERRLDEQAERIERLEARLDAHGDGAVHDDERRIETDEERRAETDEERRAEMTDEPRAETGEEDADAV